jgi:uncharacterized protein involved in exopolysaccharide biosynthesis
LSDTSSELTGEVDSIDASEIAQLVWRYKLQFAIMLLLPTLLFGIYLLLTPNVYRSEALVSPGTAQATNPLGALASQYGGLIGVAGLGVSINNNDKSAIGLEKLESTRFLGEFIDRHELLIPLFAAKGWDPQTRELILDPKVFDPQEQVWTRNVASPRTPRPSNLEAVDQFRELLDVRRDGETGLVTIGIRHYSPDLAQQWVAQLIHDINVDVRDSDVKQAQDTIAYLEDQVESTSLSEVRAVFYGLIEEQVKTVMLARVRDEYFLETIDPAVVPEEHSEPKRIILLALCFVLFAVLGVAAILAYSALLGRR